MLGTLLQAGKTKPNPPVATWRLAASRLSASAASAASRAAAALCRSSALTRSWLACSPEKILCNFKNRVQVRHMCTEKWERWPFLLLSTLPNQRVASDIAYAASKCKKTSKMEQTQ